LKRGVDLPASVWGHGEILDTARISVALPKGYEATTFTILIPHPLPLTLGKGKWVGEGISKAEARQRKGVDLVEKVGMSILIENVSKRFGTFEALDHINGNQDQLIGRFGWWLRFWEIDIIVNNSRP
jgi:hypothetical protein